MRSGTTACPIVTSCADGLSVIDLRMDKCVISCLRQWSQAGVYIFMASLLYLPSMANAADATRYPDRTMFEAKLDRIATAMPDEAAVRLQLGTPDDIVQAAESMAQQLPSVPRPWFDYALCYGTNGHMTFPTLGCVFIRDHRVVKTSRSIGHAPSAGMFAENELRRLMRLIDTSRITYHTDGRHYDPIASALFEGRVDPQLDGETYNPRHIIEIVNALQPLGKEKALAALDAYCQVVDNKWVYAILRTLFDVPANPGYLPPLKQVVDRKVRKFSDFPDEPTADPSKPDDLKAVPRFPVLLAGDIPFFVVHTYTVSSPFASAGTEIPYFRRSGIFRSSNLHPVTDPLSVPDNIMGMPGWSYRNWSATATAEHDRIDRMVIIMNQALRLLGCPTTIDRGYGWGPATEEANRDDLARIQKAWMELARPLGRKGLTWNSSLNRYATSKGAYPPDPPLLSIHVINWRPAVDDLRLNVILFRNNLRAVDSVDIFIAERFHRKGVPVVSIEFRKKGAQTPLTTILSPASGVMEREITDFQVMHNGGFSVPRGAAVTINVLQSGKVIGSMDCVP